MEEKVDFKTIWRSAGVPGVVLAAVSIAYMLASFYLSEASFTGSSLLMSVLDLAKIVACIYLMYTFLKNFHEDYGASRGDVRRLGKWIAILSALIFSTAMMAFYQLHPEVITEAVETAIDSYGESLDKNAMNALEKFEENFQQIFFISNFLYCSLFGWVLSALLSIRIVPSNPFAGEEIEENEGEADEQ